MQTLSADQFKSQYGEQEYNLATAKSNYAKQVNQPGFLDRISGVMQGAQQQQGEIATQAAQGKIGGLEAGLQTAGNVAKTITGGVMALPGVSQVAGAIGSGVEAVRGAVKQGAEAIGSALPESFKASHKLAPQDVAAGKPVYEQAAKNTEAVTNIADLLLTAEGGVEAAKGIAKGAAGATDLASKAADVGVEAASRVGETVKGMKPAPKTSVDQLVNPDLRGKALEKAIKSGKVSEAQGLGKRDFSQAVPNLDEMKAAVSEVPGIQNVKTNLEANNLIKDYNTQVHNDLLNRLAQENTYANPNMVESSMNEVRQTLNENPTMVGDASAAGEKMIAKFKNLVKEKGYTSLGIEQARIALDQWAGAGKKFTSTSADNGATFALREIRNAANKMTEDLSPNTETKALRRKQAMLAKAQEIVAQKAAREGNTKVQQFIKKHPIMTKAVKIGTAGTIAGKAAKLAE